MKKESRGVCIAAGLALAFLCAAPAFGQTTSDLAIAVSDSPDPVRVGTNLVYSITLTNAGPHAAADVVVTDILPTNMTFVSCALSQGSYEQVEDEVTCDLGSLGVGATAAVTIVVLPILEGVVTNNVSVGSSGEDPDPGNNRAFCVTTNLPQNRSPVIAVPGPHTLVVGMATCFLVTVQDPDHDPGLAVVNTVYPAGAAFANSNWSWTAAAGYAGTSNRVVFVADDGEGEPNSIVTNSTWVVVLFDSNDNQINDGWEWTHFSNLTTSATADNDGDKSLNIEEYIAGTQPTNAASLFRILACSGSSMSSNRTVTVSTETNRKYTIRFASGAYSNNTPWASFRTAASGVWIETRGSTNYTFTDDEGTNTTGSAPLFRQYRVSVEMQ